MMSIQAEAILPKTLKRVGIAADHGGFELKEFLAGKLRDAGYKVTDFGDRRLNLDDDYPDFIIPLARAVAAGSVDRGLGICGSGVGASVAANKVAGVRAGLIDENFSAHQGVEDDDLNMICFGGLLVGHALAWELARTFLAAQFIGAKRFRRRLAKVAQLENTGHDKTDSPDYRTADLMKTTTRTTTLFLDIGGVLLTNGWDHHVRRHAAKHFDLNWAEMQERHELNFEIHEEDKITFLEYLDRVIFWRKRPFTRAEFRQFIFAQSKPFTEMIGLVRNLKAKYRLKVIVVSNEAREVNAYRIRQFKLAGFVDACISSCFVHLRKPDADIFRLAIDIAQVPARQIIYIENTPLFVQIAESLGIRSILHTECKSTCAKLAAFGLPLGEGVINEAW